MNHIVNKLIKWTVRESTACTGTLYFTQHAETPFGQKLGLLLGMALRMLCTCSLARAETFIYF